MEFKGITRTFTVAASSILLGLSGGSPASADPIADFYKGKVMTIYIGVAAGGGYDAYGRVVARHIIRHIPGNPDMVAKNYTGAGGIRMVNALYNVFPQDGTVVAIIGRNVVAEPLFGNKSAKYDGSRIQWLGSLNSEYSMCTFWHESPIKTTEDLLTRRAVVGGVGVGSTIDVHTRLVNNLLGAKLKLVTGYPGGADVNLATERREVDGRCGWSWSSILATGADWLKNDKISMTIQFAMKKHPDLQNVPLILDMVRNERDRKALKVHLAAQLYGRPLGVGPGVPKERFLALRKAFDATMKDSEFLADAKKRRLPIDPTSGEDVQAMIDEVYAMPRDIIEYAHHLGTSSDRTEVATAVVPVVTYKGIIADVKRGGRRVSWSGEGKKGRLRVSGSGTEISIAGAKGKRGALKPGMLCAFTVKGAETALKIACN